MTEPLISRPDPLWRQFHDLMPYRVREVLLVSSLYDFFILEEDGRLTERVFTQYSELNLSSAPRITHAPTGTAALELLAERRFDLVVTMIRLEDIDVQGFGRSVKRLAPGMPVVLLALTEGDLSHYPSAADPSSVDLVFLWTGDSHILLAIIKQIEDRLNAKHDCGAGDVRVIVVVEDSIRRYSNLLSVLYTELMEQSQSLITEGMNDLQRLTRMRARPKLLLARTYEEALDLYQSYRDNVFALISDIRFPRDGVEDPQAGIDLVRTIRADRVAFPVLLQSAEGEDVHFADELQAVYMDKNANVLREIRHFVSINLGFGDFVFRLSNGDEVDRAQSVRELERALATVPAESLVYHFTRNDISRWLMARSMFQLAREIRPWTLDEAGGIEGNRERLIAILRRARRAEQEGGIADYAIDEADVGPPIMRLGTGSIGGKGRGLAFVRFLLAKQNAFEWFSGLQITVPRTVVLGTDWFDRFVEENELQDVVTAPVTDEEILRAFLQARLPEDLYDELKSVHDQLPGPLAVRSSSLLEDAHSQPFAGIYATYMLPNNHPDPKGRYSELAHAIKAVYASAYSEMARAYVANTPYALEEERMGIVIQELVGRQYGDRFYPTISGVALSYNFYPIGSQRADEGVVQIALGLGEAVVQGEAVLQFSPATPTITAQFSTARELFAGSQSSFLALNLAETTVDFIAGPRASLVRCGLDAAEKDSTLSVVGSVYVADEDRIRDGLHIAGPRLVTFNNILKWKSIPLAEALGELLRVFASALGCAVEMEFAVHMGDYGRHVPRGQERTPPRLYVLQVRPQGCTHMLDPIRAVDFAPEALLIRTDCSLGHGVIEDIRDVVYVRREDLTHTQTPDVASAVGELNARLVEEDRPYLLIGPGRWGSSDPSLGVPVDWSKISGARVIVETSIGGRDIEPSQGTHFFHNILSFKIGYLTVSTVTKAAPDRAMLDMEWLEKQPATAETAELRHIRLAAPLGVHLDGKTGTATILKPG